MVDLGTGTSFDVSSYPGYQNFTVDNFLVSSVTDASSRQYGTLVKNCQDDTGATTSWVDNSLSQTKSYNAATGILNFSIYSYSYTRSNCGSGATGNTSTVHAYLVY